MGLINFFRKGPRPDYNYKNPRDQINAGREVAEYINARERHPAGERFMAGDKKGFLHLLKVDDNGTVLLDEAYTPKIKAPRKRKEWVEVRRRSEPNRRYFMQRDGPIGMRRGLAKPQGMQVNHPVPEYGLHEQRPGQVAPGYEQWQPPCTRNGPPGFQDEPKGSQFPQSRHSSVPQSNVPPVYQPPSGVPSAPQNPPRSVPQSNVPPYSRPPSIYPPSNLPKSGYPGVSRGSAPPLSQPPPRAPQNLSRPTPQPNIPQISRPPSGIHVRSFPQSRPPAAPQGLSRPVPGSNLPALSQPQSGFSQPPLGNSQGNLPRHSSTPQTSGSSADPLITAKLPLGARGQRIPVPGQSKINPKQFGPTNDPDANFKYMEALDDLRRR